MKEKDLNLTDYERKRNKLIPEAVRLTNIECGENAPENYTGKVKDKWNSRWSSTYIRNMDKLYSELEMNQK